MANKMKQAAMDRVGELPIMMFDHIADASKMVRPRQTLREMCDAEFGDWVNVPVAALRDTLDDAERYKYVLMKLGVYHVITHTTDWFRLHSRKDTPNDKSGADAAIDAAIKATS